MTSWGHARFHSSPTHRASGVCVDARADIGYARDLLRSGPHPMHLERVQPQAALSCVQHVPWVQRGRLCQGYGAGHGPLPASLGLEVGFEEREEPLDDSCSADCHGCGSQANPSVFNTWDIGQRCDST